MRTSEWTSNFSLINSYVVAAGAQSPWARRRRIELAELGQRTVDVAAAGKHGRVDRDGGLSRQRT